MWLLVGDKGNGRCCGPSTLIELASANNEHLIQWLEMNKYLTRILGWGNNFQVAMLVEALKVRKGKLLAEGLDEYRNVTTEVFWSLMQFAWGNIEVNSYFIHRFHGCALDPSAMKH